jgi:hypothetical protein
MYGCANAKGLWERIKPQKALTDKLSLKIKARAAHYYSLRERWSLKFRFCVSQYSLKDCFEIESSHGQAYLSAFYRRIIGRSLQPAE